MTSRREFLAVSVAGVAGLVLPIGCGRVRWAARIEPTSEYTIEQIDRVTVRLPFREIPRRAMDRELPHWRYAEVVEATLKSGHTGLGETLLFYTWGATGDDDVERARGKNAVELMWDDSLGAGLQQALFDAVAKTAGVPIHALLGRKVHDTTPLSWWNIDTPPEDMAAECKEAHRQGYRSYKTKGRPWFDVWDQVAAAATVVPESFKIDMDFNDTLLDAERAIPILKDLEKHPQVDIYETPIPQGDVPGNRAIRDATRVNIAMHFGNPRPDVAVREGVCDGFVIGGGARRVMSEGSFSGQADMPFWLQLVGTGITAAHSLHFGGVLSHARWPAVNCHQLYVDDLLTKPIEVVDGFSKVPDGPGLGYELDREAVKRYRVDKPEKRPNPDRLVEVSWPDGSRLYIASAATDTNFVITAGKTGKIPFYKRGVRAKLFPNDGSAAWRKLFDEAAKEPVWK